ncbi:hypothetical protein KBY84_06005 [Cyanobium sp. N.Huapi 1H5]|uniref:hypothetical protein n=1 Tax=Cyanobium sp. N.Huapi 1H5 TaxID=2823719 RepID=UPI0020CBB4D6|nr:hypothetical protein [Cyanobium sp. N.Huapi 1H5]MCP9837049.1 hypothetical protein [Cyanobium sp. N.Huapi 1H5]
MDTDLAAKPILRAAATYFALVFGTGFVLGAVRVPLLVPRLGERLAELLEMPLMALAMVLAARLVVRRQLAGRGPLTRAAVGALALALMVAAELGVGLLLRQLPLREILIGRDPVSGAVYLALLLLYALLPLLLGRGSTTTAVP